MKKSFVLLGLAALAVLLATSASADNRGVSFTGIGFIENPGPFPASQVWAMNPDGTVFLVSPSFQAGYIATWTREGGWGELVGSANAGTADISPGGVIMASGIYPGSNPPYLWPGTWTGVTDVWDPISADSGYAPCGSSRMSHYDMGGEGDFGVGLTWRGCSFAQGYLWDKATNTSIGLGSPNGKSTRANAVTADGTKVMGWGTALFGTRRGAYWQNGIWTFYGDPEGREPKICSQSGQYCTFNGSGTNGCPEFVDDGFCPNDSKGTCVSGVCVGGYDAGNTCTSNSQCGGTCVGPNAGARCTSNGQCPDTLVCIPNPEWTDDLFKGEVYSATDDGRYATGRNFDSGAKSNSGFRANPDGTFTEIPPPETWPYLVDPYGGISADGKVIGGVAGTRLTGTAPIVWIEGVGTLDFQLFLIAQGLDELYFWYLAQVNAVSADGTVVAGFGYNPDNRMEGFVVDMSKLWVCHAPPGQPERARTLGVSLEGVADHVAHGDFLGTCEFLNSGGLSRAADLRKELAELAQKHAADDARLDGIGRRGTDIDPWTPTTTTTSRERSGASQERRAQGARREH
jgi:hypothetical protein